MAVSHFKITRLPSSDIISLIGNDILLIDTLYPIERQNEIQFKRIEALEGYYVSDSFSYQAYEEDNLRYGNIADSVIEWKENDLATDMISEDLFVEMIGGESTNLLSVMPINKSVEYVYIVEANGINNTDSNGVPIVPGNRLSPSEMNSATFKVIQGGGSPYFELKYKLGRGSELSEEIYTFSVDVEAIAEITLTDSSTNLFILDDDNGFPVEYARHSFEMKIQNAVSQAEVLLEITSTLPWIENGGDHYLEVTASEELHRPTTSPYVYQMIARSDSRGIIDVLISSETELDNSPIAGTVEVRIVDVNGDTELVSTINHTAIAEINS